MSAARPPAPPAPPQRRLAAFVADRVVSVLLHGGLAWWAYAVLARPGHVTAAVLAVGAFLACHGALVVALLARYGVSAGRAALGLRVVPRSGAATLGARPAAARALVVVLAGWPTLGIGAAALAWTALTDPSGRRLGIHDRLVGTEVVDVRRVAEPAQGPPQQPSLVNLTTLRLSAGAAARPRTPEGPRGVPRGGGEWRVAFDTGEALTVVGLTLVGRRPEPRRGEPADRLVRLPSHDGSLAGTHAQFQVAPDGALVLLDRHSASGSVIVRRGHAREAPPGRATTLVDGDAVRFGDRTMTVTRAEIRP